jgi:hypothetical protein
MMTPEGARWILALMAGALSNVSVVVSDGESSATSAGQVRVENDQVIVSATFGESEANFTWRSTAIRVGGVDIDVATEDMGRKAPGAVWTAETVFELPKT